MLRNTNFRKALSQGFDRKRVIDVAWGGLGDPKAATISPQSWHFAGPEGKAAYQKWAAADATMNLDQANKWLDELGMKKGADGFRTLPSGKPFTLVMDVSDWGGSLKVQTDAAAEMKNQWEKNLGIKVEIKNLQGQPDSGYPHQRRPIHDPWCARFRDRHHDLPRLDVPGRQPLYLPARRPLVRQGRGRLQARSQDPERLRCEA